MDTEVDEMDIIMSQMDCNKLVEVNEKGIELDEMDIIMSQIDDNALQNINLYDGNVSIVGHGLAAEVASNCAAEVNEGASDLDEMDIIMSQIDDNALQNNNLCDGNVWIVGHGSATEVASNCPAEELETIASEMPDELLDDYRSAINELDEEMVNGMKNEPDEVEELPPELLEEFQSAMDQILPVKSGNRYLQAYEVFRKWQDSYGIRNITEEIVMAYFVRASRKFKPPTLWSMYSMLKKTFIVKHNIDLKSHCRLRAFLKTKADGYIGKKANVFTQDEIHRFLMEAPNHVYLGMKVIGEKFRSNFSFFYFYFFISRLC